MTLPHTPDPDAPPPVHNPRRLARVPEATHGHLVAAVVRHTGQDHDVAEQTVRALLGPLKLAPPLGDDAPPPDAFCTHGFFTHDGEWKWCAGDPKDHASGTHMSAWPDPAIWHEGAPRAVEGTAWEQ